MDSDFFIPGGLFEDDESMQSMSGINPGAREFRPTEPEPRARRAQSADAPPPAFAGGGLLSPSQLGAAAAAPRGAGPPGLDPRRPRLGSASGAPGAGLGDRGDAWRHHNERMTTAAAAAAAALRALAEEDAKGRALATSSAASWDAAPAAWSAPAAPAPGLEARRDRRPGPPARPAAPPPPPSPPRAPAAPAAAAPPPHVVPSPPPPPSFRARARAAAAPRPRPLVLDAVDAVDAVDAGDAGDAAPRRVPAPAPRAPRPAPRAAPARPARPPSPPPRALAAPPGLHLDAARRVREPSPSRAPPAPPAPAPPPRWLVAAGRAAAAARDPRALAARAWACVVAVHAAALAEARGAPATGLRLLAPFLIWGADRAVLVEAGPYWAPAALWAALVFGDLDRRGAEKDRARRRRRRVPGARPAEPGADTARLPYPLAAAARLVAPAALFVAAAGARCALLQLDANEALVLAYALVLARRRPPRAAPYVAWALHVLARGAFGPSRALAWAQAVSALATLRD